MGLFDKFKKKENVNNVPVPPQSEPLEQNVVPSSPDTESNQAIAVTVSPDSNPFVETTPQEEVPNVEQQQVPTFDNMFNATPGDLIMPENTNPVVEEQQIPEMQIQNVEVNEAGEVVAEQPPIAPEATSVEYQVQDPNQQPMLNTEGIVDEQTKEDMITQMVSDNVDATEQMAMQEETSIPVAQPEEQIVNQVATDTPTIEPVQEKIQEQVIEQNIEQPIEQVTQTEPLVEQPVEQYSEQLINTDQPEQLIEENQIPLEQSNLEVSQPVSQEVPTQEIISEQITDPTSQEQIPEVVMPAPTVENTVPSADTQVQQDAPLATEEIEDIIPTETIIPTEIIESQNNPVELTPTPTQEQSSEPVLELTNDDNNLNIQINTAPTADNVVEPTSPTTSTQDLYAEPTNEETQEVEEQI